MVTNIFFKKDKATDNDPKEELLSMQSSKSYQLLVQNQPPSFVFLREPFTVEFLIVAEDHKHSEKLCNSHASSQEESNPSSQSHCKQNDEINDSSTTLIPSFDIIVELIANATQTHVSSDIENAVTENMPITDGTVAAPNVAPKVQQMATTCPQERPGLQNMLTLNILKDPSPVALGEVGTVQCSLTGGRSLDHMLSLRHRKLSLSPSSANSTIVMDTNTMTCQLRIIAFLCGKDPPRKRTKMHRSTTDMSDPPTANACIALTSSIAIVQHKILITSCNNDGSSHGNSGYNNESIRGKDWNSVWYKDEGGRDKCMEIIVGVYDCQHAALFEAIPLLLTLCYASSNQQSLKQNLLSLSPLLPIPVTNQEILNVLSPKPSQRFVIDRDTGTMKIRFRVEDVSKNHQGQDFCLMIAAALDNGDYHYLQNYRPAMIAPAISFPVNVRSKRNKRPRQYTTVSSSISIPTSDVSSEHVYPHSSAVPSMGTVLSSNTNSAAMVENYPRLRAIQLQDALRSVVQWIQDVVTRTTYEIQRQEAQNGILSQYLSSMSQSMTTYDGEIQEHLNLLQYIIDSNSTSLSSRSLTDPNYNQTMHNTRDESIYQRQPTTSDSFRSYGAGNFHYSQGYYHESTISNSGNIGFHNIYPYQYQNQMYHAIPHTQQQNRPSVMNDYHSLPIVAGVKRYGPHTHFYPSQKEREICDYPLIESTNVSRDENLSLGSKRQSPPPTPQINTRTTEIVQETKKVKSSQASSFKKVEFQEEYPSNTITYKSMDLCKLDGDHGETRENEVEYVFAKQFKSLRSGALLGYPAYTIKKELIGFYQQVQVIQSIDIANASQQQRNDQKSPPTPPLSRSHVFVPVQKEDFGASQLEHAKVILDQADRYAIQAMSHCGSIEAMLHRALVYEWSQGLTNV